MGFVSWVSALSLSGGLSLGLGWGFRVGVGVGRSGAGRSGVLRARVAPVAALALASREHSSVLSMNARCRLSYLEEATPGRGLRKRS
jgi:hypothetical protein